MNEATASATALARQIGEEFGQLDVLVSNAAIYLGTEDGQASDVSIDALRRTFEVNFFGTVAFTQPLLPLLRAAEKAQIVNVRAGLAHSPSTEIQHALLSCEGSRLQRFEGGSEHVSVRGDPFERQERHWVTALDARHTLFDQWLRRRMENTFGLQIRTTGSTTASSLEEGVGHSKSHCRK